MTHLIIKHNRPYQIVALAIAVSLMIFTTLWLLLDESHWSYIKSRVAIGQESKHLWAENRALEAENKRLRERIIMLERTTQIDSQAAAELHEEMKKLQDEIYSLKGELEFYQAIMTSTSSTRGLSIQGMQIDRLQVENNFHFKLILTHVEKSDKVAEGMVEISLEGLQDGVAKVLNISDVVLNKAIDLSFNFKNFKRIEGNMMIPDGFTPHRVIVRLQPKDTKLSKIKRVFDWSEMLG
jgi:cell division protein FtsB